ncbi:hypothetical protein ACFQZ4_04890 [Catellatospora coxensis]
MSTDQLLLTHPDPPTPRHLRLEVDGARLRRCTWRGSGKERCSSRDFPNHEAARDALAREAAARMREGFAYVRDAAGTPPGEPVLRCAPPNRYGPQTFDLHPQGHTLAVASLRRDAYGADLHLVEVATGRRRLVHTEAPGSGPTGQTFIHAVLFDADGTGLVYALNGETRHLDLATGTTRVLAHYEHLGNARFNHFCTRPAQDATRRRLLLFDAGDQVRVRDTGTGEDVLVVPVADRPECRAGALSPSGRLLALAFGVDDSIVQVWHVETGQLLHSTPSRSRSPAPPAAPGSGTWGSTPARGSSSLPAASPRDPSHYPSAGTRSPGRCPIRTGPTATAPVSVGSTPRRGTFSRSAAGWAPRCTCRTAHLHRCRWRCRTPAAPTASSSPPTAPCLPVAVTAAGCPCTA